MSEIAFGRDSDARRCLHFFERASVRYSRSWQHILPTHCSARGGVVGSLTSFSQSYVLPIQGDPYGRGKDYVDIKFKVPSQAWVAAQPYS